MKSKLARFVWEWVDRVKELRMGFFLYCLGVSEVYFADWVQYGTCLGEGKIIPLEKDFIEAL